jgi:short subunit dehydrogenase-like uncharacterized protein
MSSTRKRNGKVDLTVYGATGYTGDLICEYLAKNVPLNKCNWAIAGRSEKKLKELKEKLCKINPDCAAVSILTADIYKQSSLNELAAHSSLIIDCVGPFELYGEPVVNACIQNGTHYIDITGEPGFMEHIFDNYSEKAKAAGVLIIPACGLDYIPADIVTYKTLQHIPGNESIQIDAFMQFNQKFSSGTMKSMVEVVGKKTKHTALVKQFSHYALPHYNKDIKGWVAPFPAGDLITVFKTKESISSYPKQFRYSSWVKSNSLIGLILMGVVFTLIFIVLQFKIGRKLAGRFITEGGAGAEDRKKHYWSLTAVGRSSNRKETVRTVLKGGDVYEDTAIMAVCTALTILQDYNRIPLKAGVTTTMAALREPLIERLKATRITLSTTLERHGEEPIYFKN